MTLPRPAYFGRHRPAVGVRRLTLDRVPAVVAGHAAAARAGCAQSALGQQRRPAQFTAALVAVALNLDRNHHHRGSHDRISLHSHSLSRPQSRPRRPPDRRTRSSQGQLQSQVYPAGCRGQCRAAYRPYRHVLLWHAHACQTHRGTLRIVSAYDQFAHVHSTPSRAGPDFTRALVRASCWPEYPAANRRVQCRHFWRPCSSPVS